MAGNFEEMFKGLGELEEELRKKRWASPFTHTWNDDKFINMFKEKLPVFKLPSLAESYAMGLQTYAYWILGQDLQFKDDLINVAALMGSPFSDKPDDLMFPCFFSSEATDPLILIRNLAPDSLEELAELVGKAKPDDPGLFKFLTSLDSEADVELKHKMFVNFVSYSSLMLLRCYSKNEKTVHSAYNKSSAETFCRLFGYESTRITSMYPLNASLLPTIFIHFKKCRSFNTHKYVLAASLKVLFKEKDSKARSQIKVLESSHLIHLYYYGLRTITLLYEAAQKLNLTPKILNSYLSCGRTAETSNRVEKFMAVENLTGKDITVPFCRIFDEDFYVELAVKKNMHYCYRLALVLSDENPGIFKMEAFKHIDEWDISAAKEWHRELTDRLKSSQGSSQGFRLPDGAFNITRDIYG